MSKLKKYMNNVDEVAAYAGNLGFEEMAKFYQTTSDDDIELMEKLLEKNDWNGFKKLIKKVIGIMLK